MRENDHYTSIPLYLNFPANSHLITLLSNTDFREIWIDVET